MLLETKEAVSCLEKTLELEGIDEFHVGLNDLRISYGYSNMFQPFGNGLLEVISASFKRAGIPFGIGGIGQFGLGLLPSPEELIIEHYRLGSSAVILSRTFCNVDKLPNLRTVEEVLNANISHLRRIEKEVGKMTSEQLELNHINIIEELK